MSPEPAADAKRELRRAMRRVRLEIADPERRAAAVWERVESLPEVVAARTVMAFRSIAGEPDTSPFLTWCESAGKQVVLPEPDRAAAFPIDPAEVDVVIVPGLAFTTAGARLGQGGGWYDRFLAAVRPECRTIGVCFAPQVLQALPVEDHDVRVDVVVSDTGVWNSSRGR